MARRVYRRGVLAYVDYPHKTGIQFSIHLLRLQIVSFKLHTNMSDNAKRDLIIVSNRLPLSVKRVDGSYESSVSSGGLVTALSGLTKSTQFRWFGWPGIEVKDIEDRKQVSQCLAEHNANPVFLDSDLAHEHYNGFSSKVL